jgi:hypothetical protein
MHVIDCDRCNETLTAANHNELAHAVRAHFEAEHGEKLEDSEIQELLAVEEYEATDS